MQQKNLKFCVLFDGFVGKSGKSSGNETMSFRVPAEK
jgi:hypothetical protein